MSTMDTHEVAVELTRTIPAPPREVYRAFLDPARLRRWLGPDGFTVTDVVVEERVGGRHRTEIVSREHGRHAFDCVIRELVPDARIALAWVFEDLDAPGGREESLVTVTLRPAAAGGTELTLVHERLSGPADGVREGWEEALGHLEVLYAGGAHRTGTREEWLVARRALLEREKELTRLSDELARERRALPWVPVEKPYRFDTAAGRRTLAELFDGRSQLLVYHFMYGPDWDAGCPSCTSIGDHIDGFATHLEHHDVTILAVARAPFETLDAYRRRMGWSFPLVSSAPSDFNEDFHVSGDVHAAYNFGTVADDPRYDSPELPGMSAFALADGVVHHTYSAYARGLDALWGVYQWLDRAPLGRNDSMDSSWMRRHDEY